MADEESRTKEPPPLAPEAPRPAPADRGLAGWVRSVAEDVAGEVGVRLRKLAMDAGAASAAASAAFFSQPGSARLAEEAGHSLRELRELAGLTVDELAAALDLEDKTLIEAVENGTATISFELLLRLSAILARHDPIPFLIRFTRSYNPELWRRFEGVGATRLPLQFERERQFVNIIRGDDRARNLSDEGFRKVLDFTRSAFALALHYAVEDERRAEGHERSPASAGPRRKPGP